MNKIDKTMQALALGALFAIYCLPAPAQDNNLATPSSFEPSKSTTDSKSLEKLPVSGVEIAKHARELGMQHPDWWKNGGAHGEIRKCNQYLDRVFRDFAIPVPWTDVIPGVHTMREILAESPDWQIVYKASQPFASFKIHPGDLVIWDADTTRPTLGVNRITARRHIEHSGVMGEQGQIMYAGSYFHNGYAISDLKVMSKFFGIGAPTVVFRSKHVI